MRIKDERGLEGLYKDQIEDNHDCSFPLSATIRNDIFSSYHNQYFFHPIDIDILIDTYMTPA